MAAVEEALENLRFQLIGDPQIIDIVIDKSYKATEWPCLEGWQTMHHVMPSV